MGDPTEFRRPAFYKGERRMLKEADYVGALTRNDPDWSTRPPEPKAKPGRDPDRVAWEKKRNESR
jgi:hypothetical protein